MLCDGCSTVRTSFVKLLQDSSSKIFSRLSEGLPPAKHELIATTASSKFSSSLVIPEIHSVTVNDTTLFYEHMSDRNHSIT